MAIARPRRPRPRLRPDPATRPPSTIESATSGRRGDGTSDRYTSQDAAEAEYRRTHDHLQRLRPGYAHELELGAVGTGRHHASAMVTKINRLIDRGHWTRSEQTSLYQARRKWERRAVGDDPRYLLTGSNARGPLPRHLQAHVDVLRRAQEAETLIRTTLTSLKARRRAPGGAQGRPGALPIGDD